MFMEIINDLNKYTFPETRPDSELEDSSDEENNEKAEQTEETPFNSFNVSTCQELLDYEVQPEYFVINPIFPKEAISSISASSGAGKSLFVLLLSKHIATGAPLFDAYPVEKSSVLIIDQEMNKNEIVTRFKKLIDENIPISYIIDQKFSITDEDDFNNLVKLIIHNGYQVVIFDTFTEIHSSEENDSGAMKKVNEKLLELIRKTKVSILHAHHNRKPQKGERINMSSSRGSSEIVAKLSSLLLLESKNYKDELENKVLEMTLDQSKARSSSRLDGKISLKIINDELENKIKWEYLGEVEEKGKKVEEAKVFIMEVLSSCAGATVKDLEEKSDIGTSNIRIALKELVSENKIDVGKEGKAKYYFMTT